MSYDIGFTGTRDVPEDRIQKLKNLMKKFDAKHDDIVLHSGDCVGADELAFKYAKKLGWKNELHPPTNPKYRAYCKGYAHPEKDYLARNRDIVDSSKVLIAFPKDPDKEELRSGTWATIRYAKKRGKKIYYV